MFGFGGYVWVCLCRKRSDSDIGDVTSALCAQVYRLPSTVNTDYRPSAMKGRRHRRVRRNHSIKGGACMPLGMPRTVLGR